MQNLDYQKRRIREAIDYDMLNDSFEKAIKKLNEAEIKLRSIRHSRIYWATLAFILGTIFFMIISKAK